jgi:hypothetical protein
MHSLFRKALKDLFSIISRHLEQPTPTTVATGHRKPLSCLWRPHSADHSRKRLMEKILMPQVSLYPVL